MSYVRSLCWLDFSYLLIWAYSIVQSNLKLSWRKKALQIFKGTSRARSLQLSINDCRKCQRLCAASGAKLEFLKIFLICSSVSTAVLCRVWNKQLQREKLITKLEWKKWYGSGKKTWGLQVRLQLKTLQFQLRSTSCLFFFFPALVSANFAYWRTFQRFHK